MQARRLSPQYKIDILKIISGGQTGVDRAALDAALKHGIKCGGWCPAGRLDEFGRIPDRYPVKELEQGSLVERTMQNVKDSDATVIIYFDKLRGGTEQTVRFCIEQHRPHKLINAAEVSVERAAQLVADLCAKKRSRRSMSRVRAKANGRRVTITRFK